MTGPQPLNQEVHDNLKTLYAAFSKDAIDQILSGESYTVDGVEFVSQYAQGSTASRFFIVKPPKFVEYFVEFCAEFAGGTMFELGIAEGGSTALLALTARPETLVAVDLEPHPLAALDEFAAERGLTGMLRLRYGVDQADRTRLHSIVGAELAGRPIDLVLDDASHQLVPTRASFEALFPFVRPGGAYTIEDWNADLRFRDQVLYGLQNPSTPEELDAAVAFRRSIAAGSTSTESRPPPLPPTMSQLAVELLLACASSSEVIASVTVNEHWIEVRRGPATVDPLTFSLSGLYRDYYGFVPDVP